MEDKLISKNKSLALKFIAMILMVLLHLFAFPNRIKSVEYISIFPFNRYPIEFYIGRFSSICVGMFIFLSGYGLYISYSKEITYKGIFKRIYKIYINYWVVFLVFIPIGIYMNKYEFNFKQFILNFIGVSDSYNGEWWFLRLYILLLLIYPILTKIIDKYNKYLILIISFIANIGGYGLTKITISLEANSSLIALIGIVLGGQFLFLLGIMIARYGGFTKLSEKINLNRKAYICSLLILVVIVGIIVDIPIIGEVLKLILTPIFIFILVNIINENSYLTILGRHSTNIWLIHSFFTYYLFQKFTFSIKYSILVVTQLIVINILISIVINKLLYLIKKILGGG